jgi:hypothetical protein
MTNDFPMVAWSAVLVGAAVGRGVVLNSGVDVTGVGIAGRSGSLGRVGVVEG